MPILNMIAQGGGGGSNVGEPTNLSASVTSATSIDITWTDNNLQTIPPSTFQKSVLVRKVGSAPTTPSDGTTVVTETVMNTYQSSAYSDTGLTQGTTYYYQVFSYSTDGGITYGTPVSATPQGGWQPGVNTVAYYPLNSVSMGNDMSGNEYNLSTTGTVTYATGLGVDSMVGGNGYLYKQISTIPVGASARTLSIWAYLPSITYNTSFTMCFYGTANSRHAQQTMAYNTYDNSVSPYISNYYDDLYDSSVDNSLPQWYNIICTYDGTTQYLYNNGVLIAQQNIELTTGNNTLYIGSNENGSDKFQGNLSALIIENVAWTAQQVADYYDQTKASYGIS